MALFALGLVLLLAALVLAVVLERQLADRALFWPGVVVLGTIFVGCFSLYLSASA